MKFRILYLLICFLLLVAYTNETLLPQKQSPEKKIEMKVTDDNTFETEDGKITFKIFNTVKVPKSTVQSIKKEVLIAYENIHDYINTGYVPSQRINIFLLEGDLPSWGLKSEIKLYSVRKGQYPLVHELTHTLLGYGSNFDTSRGYLTQEGLAMYMDNKFGKKKYPVHKLMKNFIISKKTIPLNKLTDTQTDDELFRLPLVNPEDISLQWMSYTHAGSFVTYIIETYGLEKFEKIYNQDKLDEKFLAVYGKTTKELEIEWLSFITENINELDIEDKMKIDYFYEKNSAIHLINPEVFQR